MKSFFFNWSLNGNYCKQRKLYTRKVGWVWIRSSSLEKWEYKFKKGININFFIKIIDFNKKLDIKNKKLFHYLFKKWRKLKLGGRGGAGGATIGYSWVHDHDPMTSSSKSETNEILIIYYYKHRVCVWLNGNIAVKQKLKIIIVRPNCTQTCV